MKRKASLLRIFLTIFLDLLGFGILIPLLPNFANEVLFIDEFSIGAIIAIYSLVQFFFNPFAGRISDKYGRRPVILTALLITAISYIVFAFANSFAILLFSRFLAGLGGSIISAGQAYIADITSKEDRAKGLGLIGAAFGFAFVLGPVIGGLLSTISYSVAGYVASGFSVLSFLFAFFFLKESHKPENRKLNLKVKFIDFKAAKEVITSPSIGLPVILFSVIVFSMANIYGTFALLGRQVYNFSDKEIGYLFGIVGITSALVQGGLIKHISKKLKVKTILIIGLILLMSGLTATPYGVNFLGVAIISVVLGLGTSLLQPTVQSIVSKRTAEDVQGKVLSINQSFSALARVAGPLWGGFAFEYIGYPFPFLTGALFTFLTIFVVLRYFKFD